MTLRKAVQERINELMSKQGLSQYKLSKISGVPQSTISSILNDDSDSCSLSVVYQLSQHLCNGIHEFFNDQIFTATSIDSKYD